MTEEQAIQLLASQNQISTLLLVLVAVQLVTLVFWLVWRNWE